MKKRERMIKTVISGLLCLVLIISGLPRDMVVTSVKAGTSGERASLGSITVDSGLMTIAEGETVTQDIYVTDRAALSVYGKVTGTIYVRTTDFCNLYTDEEGNSWLPDNLLVENTAEVESIVLEGKARTFIRGKINRITFEEGALADGGVSRDAHVGEIVTHGPKEKCYLECSVDRLYVTAGECFLATMAQVGSLTAVGGNIINNGTIDTLRLSGDATFSNWLERGANPKTSAYIKSVILESNNYTDMPMENVAERFVNFGIVDGLVSYGSDVINFGTIHNMWVKGGRIDIDSGAPGAGDTGEPYSVDRLYASGVYIYANGTNEGSSRKYVKEAVINGGECNLASGLFEKLTFGTLPHTVLFEGETDIKDLTVLDDSDVSEKECWLDDMGAGYVKKLSVTGAFEQNGAVRLLEILGFITGDETPEEMGIADEDDYFEARDNYYQSLLELAKGQGLYSVLEASNRNPVADYSMSTGMGAADIRKNLASAGGTVIAGNGAANSAAGSISGSLLGGANICLNANAEAWFEFDITEAGKYTLNISAGETEALAMLILPEDGGMCGAAGGSDSASAVSLTAGKGYVAVFGAETPASVSLKREDLNYIVPQYFFGDIDEISGKTVIVPASRSDVTYHVYMNNGSKEITNVRETENGLLLNDKLLGNTLTIEAIPHNGEKYMSGTAEFTYAQNGTVSPRITMYEYGKYSGSIKGNSEISIYIYNGEGEYCGNAEVDGSRFATAHLSDGYYTAVFIRDNGDYCFDSLAEFESFGLKNHEDYIKDSFEIVAGEAAKYYNVSVPSIQPRTYKYIDAEKTELRISTGTALPDTLVNLVLEYSLNGKDIENADAIITLMNGTRLEGEQLVINGQRTVEFEIEDGVIKAPLGKVMQGKVSMCIAAGEDAAKVGAIAEIRINDGKNETAELVGTAAAELVQLTVNAPQYTSEDSIYVFGKAIPGSTVIIYDGSVQIGTTCAKAGGSYELKTNLFGGAGVYEHSIYAAIDYNGSRIVSTAATVKRNSFSPTLESIIMHYEIHGEETTMSMTGDEFVSKDYVYLYWPGTIYTFEIELSSDDAVTAVYMGSNSSGVKREIKADYDSSLGKWVAKGRFSEDENYLPANFYIRYVTGNALEVAKINGADGTDNYDCFINYRESDEYKSAMEQEAKCTEIYSEETEGGMTDVVLLENEELGMSCLVSSTLELSVEPLDEAELTEQGYIKVQDEDGISFYKYEIDPETGDFKIHIIDINQDPELYDVYNQAAANSGLHLMAEDDTDSGFGKAKDIIFDNYGWASNVISGISQSPIGNTGKIVGDWIEVVNAVDDFFEFTQSIEDAIADGYYAYQDSKYYMDMIKDMNNKSDYLRQMLEQIQKQQEEHPENTCFPNIGDMGKLVDEFEKSGVDAANGAAANVWGDYFMGVALDFTLGRVGGAGGKIAGKGAGALLKGMKRVRGGSLIRKGVADAAEDKLGGIFDDYIGKFNECVSDMIRSFSPGYIAEGSMDGLDKLSAAVQDKLEECFPTPPITPTPTPAPTPTDGPGFPDGPGDPNENNRNDGNDGTIKGAGPTITLEDPSGYVYAGIPENRISGVTCRVYYKDENGQAVLWNAEEYDQINPQVTDHTGAFFWMVPKGEWKVICEAEGYETYETEWLQVPPPQTEVNINLMSIYAPKVESFAVNTKYAMVNFNMYVDISSVEKAAVSLKDANGKNVKYTLVPVISDTSADEAGLAKAFILDFEGRDITEGSYSVSVSGDILGYNGKTMEGSFTDEAKASSTTAEEENLLLTEKTAAKERQSGQKNQNLPIIIAIAAVVVLAAASTCVVLRRRKKDKKA